VESGKDWQAKNQPIKRIALNTRLLSLNESWFRMGLMPTELPLNLFRYSYLDFVSNIRHSFSIGIPQMMLLEFENQANQNVDKIILESLSNSEKKRLTEMLGIKVSFDGFRVLPIAPHPGSLASLESFNGDKGKRFWIYAKEIVKF
jgi:hypothetical protein